MVRHTDHGNSHISVPEYAETLTILTGKDCSHPYQYVADRKGAVRSAVEALVTEWWEPQQDKIDTDINHWSSEQFQVLASHPLPARRANPRKFTDPESWRDGPTSYGVYHLLYYHLLHAVGSERVECGRGCTPRCSRRCWPGRDIGEAGRDAGAGCPGPHTPPSRPGRV
jgi:hypothetical protein